MTELIGWDLVLWAVAAWISVAVLVRMMRQRRDEIAAELRREIDEARKREHEARKKRDAVQRAAQQAAALAQSLDQKSKAG